MRLTNHTPFPAIAFESLAPDGLGFTTLVVKATFDVRPGGKLTVADEQVPLTLSDEYYGDPLTTSVRLESDLAPFKPRADILFIDPVAFSPNGRPSRSWNVSVQVGDLRQQLRVTGPRHWRRDFLGGWFLTEPELATEVPIRYELAYGGQWTDGGKGDVCQENPVGSGVIGPREKREEFCGPQVEDPASPVRGANRSDTKPIGLTPTGRGWLPRRTLAGTFDDEWKRTQWPKLPLDFDPGHYHCADPKLQLESHFFGGEPVLLSGLQPERPHSFVLPSLRIGVLILRLNGQLDVAPIGIDTLVINSSLQTVILCGRARFRNDPQIIRLQLRTHSLE